MADMFNQPTAEELYREFFRRHPTIANPCDINCKEMFRARKAGQECQRIEFFTKRGEL